MSAIVLHVQDLLIGKSYTSESRKKSGRIIEAVKRESVEFENGTAFLITVRPEFASGSGYTDFYATVCVRKEA